MFGRYMATVVHFMKEEGRLPSDNNQQQDGVSVNESRQTGEGISSETNDEGREVESRGISSGLTQ